MKNSASFLELCSLRRAERSQGLEFQMHAQHCSSGERDARGHWLEGKFEDSLNLEAIYSFFFPEPFSRSYEQRRKNHMSPFFFVFASFWPLNSFVLLSAHIRGEKACRVLLFLPSSLSPLRTAVTEWLRVGPKRGFLFHALRLSPYAISLFPTLFRRLFTSLANHYLSLSLDFFSSLLASISRETPDGSHFLISKSRAEYRKWRLRRNSENFASSKRNDSL